MRLLQIMGWGRIRTVEADTSQQLSIQVQGPNDVLSCTFTTTDGKRLSVLLQPFHWEALGRSLAQQQGLRNLRQRHALEKAAKVAGKGYAAETELGKLVIEWETWCKCNGLPCESASDLRHRLGLTDWQLTYINDFILRWDMAEDDEHAEWLRDRDRKGLVTP